MIIQCIIWNQKSQLLHLIKHKYIDSMNVDRIGEWNSFLFVDGIERRVCQTDQNQYCGFLPSIVYVLLTMVELGRWMWNYHIVMCAFPIEGKDATGFY